jgi:uncharacterized protein (UPF0333 family)
MMRRKGQSTLEYAIIIAVVIGGLMVMQHYVKRGYSGRLKSSSDDMGAQFDPGAYTANLDYSQSANVRQTVQNKETTVLQVQDQTSNRTGNEHQAAWDPARNAYGQ